MIPRAAHGFNNLDEWHDALEDVEYELRLFNAVDDEERSRVETEYSRRAHGRLFNFIRNWRRA